MKGRFLADASTLIALSACGRLEALRILAGTVHVTPAVLREVLVERPGVGAVRIAVQDGWLVSIAADGDLPGLGSGEASLILAAASDDVLILDDRAARLEARSRALRVTGLLGFLVHGATTGRLPRAEAIAILNDLAQGNFRMTAELYRWALDALKE